MALLEKKIIEIICFIVAQFYLGKAELKDLLVLKYPTLGAVKNAVLNELYYSFRTKKGYRLTSVNLEVTNHCNLNCSMCPVKSEMRRDKGYMRFDLFKKVIDENPQLEFVLPFQWGEPLLHPEIFDMIQYATDKGIRSMMTTNGVLLDDEKTDKLLHCGLTRLTFSLDGTAEVYEKVRKVPYQDIKKKILNFISERDKQKSSLKVDLNMVVFGETENVVRDYKKEWKGIADRIQIIPRLEQKGRNRIYPCRELWRGSLVVLWDGRVVPCCADYDAKQVVGDVNKETLVNIWQGEKMQRLRRLHRKKIFSDYCRYCDEYETSLVNPRFR
ncbi:MAG: radical SAM protein [Candidatus Omnitrophota bacterium]